MDRVHIKVYGEVQGVFFRAFAVEQARELGLVGWVRNNPDGSVEAEAEGPKNKLEEFVSRMRKGPEAADVQDVDVEWAKATGEHSEFRRE